MMKIARRLIGSLLLAIPLALVTISLPAQEKKGVTKGKKAEPALTPPADAEFTKFGIYASTAPRAAAAKPFSRKPSPRKEPKNCRPLASPIV